jgi:hypothetical protein
MNIDERKTARAVCEAATEGPWETNSHNWSIWGPKSREVARIVNINPSALGDSDFIAHARTGLPAALDEIDRLEGECERLRAAIHTRVDPCEGWDKDECFGIDCGNHQLCAALAALEGRDSE